MTERQTNYFRYLLPVFESRSRISEAKLTSKSLRKGSAVCTKDVWPPVEQMTSWMGARAETGSRNMAVMAKIESSTPLPIRPPLHVWTYFQPFGRKQTTFGTRQRLISVDGSGGVTVDGTIAKFVEAVKLLVVTLDSPLTFNQQCR